MCADGSPAGPAIPIVRNALSPHAPTSTRVSSMLVAAPLPSTPDPGHFAPSLNTSMVSWPGPLPRSTPTAYSVSRAYKSLDSDDAAARTSPARPSDGEESAKKKIGVDEHAAALHRLWERLGQESKVQQRALSGVRSVNGYAFYDYQAKVDVDSPASSPSSSESTVRPPSPGYTDKDYAEHIFDRLGPLALQQVSLDFETLVDDDERENRKRPASTARYTAHDDYHKSNAVVEEEQSLEDRRSSEPLVEKRDSGHLNAQVLGIDKNDDAAPDYSAQNYRDADVSSAASSHPSVLPATERVDVGLLADDNVYLDAHHVMQGSSTAVNLGSGDAGNATDDDSSSGGNTAPNLTVSRLAQVEHISTVEHGGHQHPQTPACDTTMNDRDDHHASATIDAEMSDFVDTSTSDGLAGGLVEMDADATTGAAAHAHEQEEEHEEKNVDELLATEATNKNNSRDYESHKNNAQAATHCSTIALKNDIDRGQGEVEIAAAAANNDDQDTKTTVSDASDQDDDQGRDATKGSMQDASNTTDDDEAEDNVHYDPNPFTLGDFLESCDDIVGGFIDAAGEDRFEIWLQGPNCPPIGLLECKLAVLKNPGVLEALARIPNMTLGDAFSIKQLEVLPAVLRAKRLRVIYSGDSRALIYRWPQTVVWMPEVEEITVVAEEGRLSLPASALATLIGTVIRHDRRTRIAFEEIDVPDKKRWARNLRRHGVYDAGFFS
ncbi:hypothetical protein EXIGLDRAFT_733627 [Exidia glandulosa HHB12029]|uniref:Uncharacterized protein n=1 Tax=Exidia glandulosa HHB12029 TaxID=1314781 RepID=A0A166AYE9_EXIGL|nr:hypothetical protein EXIGLDRAFT_733627 [Exidia glandulosa HHB12029]